MWVYIKCVFSLLLHICVCARETVLWQSGVAMFIVFFSTFFDVKNVLLP